MQEKTVITPTPPPLFEELREALRFRELLYFLVARDLKVRYKQTALGALWALLQPLATLAIFAFLFGKVAHIPSDGHPYPLFAFTGLVSWLYASNATSFAAGALILDANLIRRVYFPKLFLPLANLFSGFVDFAVGLAAAFALLFYYAQPLGVHLLALPLWVAALFLATCGPALFLAAASALYRDVKYIVPFSLQLWLFLTPIAYPLSLVAEKWQPLYALNPQVAPALLGHFVLLGDVPPLLPFAISLVSALMLTLAAFRYFKSMERHFADCI